MTERFNISREISKALADSAEQAWLILPALAGEVLAGGDPVSVSELKDALGWYVFRQLPNHRIADAVLSMVRTHTIDQAARFNH